MKRWMTSFVAALFFMLPLPIYAGTTTQPNVVPTATVQTADLATTTATPANAGESRAEVIPIRGSLSFGSRSFGSRSFGRSSGSRSFGSRSFGSGSYSRSGSYSYSRPYSSPFGGFHFGSMLTGFFIGRMFNPFGFGYGYGPSLGLFHIILDIFLVWLIWRIFSRFMR